MPRVPLAALPLLLALALLAPSAIAAPGSAACTFVGGFATLHELAPDVVGDCTEPEHHDPKSGDALQATTRGLLVWRKADNWTAFTDGGTTWINGPYGLQSRPNDRRFAWEPPVQPLFEELRAFDGTVLLAGDKQEPFVSYPAPTVQVASNWYLVVYGDERVGGDALVLSGQLGRPQLLDLSVPDPSCHWVNDYCDSRQTDPERQFASEDFTGLQVNGADAVVIHSTNPMWQVNWYDAARDTTFSMAFTGDAADRLATGFDASHRPQAEYVAAVASQLIPLTDLTIYAPRG